tara:strand:+ start:320 stop:682 length:363 start_codon:yes stop_codon:yes gene_type:complete
MRLQEIVLFGLLIFIAGLIIVNSGCVDTTNYLDCGANDTCIEEAITTCEPATYEKGGWMDMKGIITVVGLNENNECIVNSDVYYMSSGTQVEQKKCLFPDYANGYKAFDVVYRTEEHCVK